MNNLTCPNCFSEMEKAKTPDITREVCPECKGVFLDKGELNTIATGMAGDIEFCSLDGDCPEDEHPLRNCPKCIDQTMRKVNLLRLSDLVFDFCPQCEGFFLDGGERQMMNKELKSLVSNKKAEEYRGFRDDHLVLVDQLKEIAFVGWTGLTRATNIRVTVYFSSKLQSNIRVFEQNWSAKLSQLFGLFSEDYIETGIPEFDQHFIVQGENREEILRILNPELRQELINFVEEKPEILKKSGSLELNSSAIVYTEGPYHSDNVQNTVTNSEKVIDKLNRFVALVEKTR